MSTTTETQLPFPATCPDCGFTSKDFYLLRGHSCAVEEFGGRCEDYPCCGHEAGDCNGQLYGSDEAIKEQVYREMYYDDQWYDDYGDEDEEDEEDEERGY